MIKIPLVNAVTRYEWINPFKSKQNNKYWLDLSYHRK